MIFLPNDEKFMLKFFDDYKDLKTIEMAGLVGKSQWYISKLKRRYGIKSKASIHFRKRIQKVDYIKVSEDVWKNQEWLYQMYVVNGYGQKIIGEMIGLSKVVTKYHLNKFGIPDRTLEDVSKSTNKHCTKEWLIQHYVLEEVSIRNCAKLANVNSYLIYLWLTKFGIPLRTSTESINITRRKNRNGKLNITKI